MSLVLLSQNVDQPNYLRIFWFSGMLQLWLSLCLKKLSSILHMHERMFFILVNHLWVSFLVKMILFAKYILRHSWLFICLNKATPVIRTFLIKYFKPTVWKGDSVQLKCKKCVYHIFPIKQCIIYPFLQFPFSLVLNMDISVTVFSFVYFCTLGNL